MRAIIALAIIALLMGLAGWLTFGSFAGQNVRSTSKRMKSSETREERRGERRGND